MSDEDSESVRSIQKPVVQDEWIPESKYSSSANKRKRENFARLRVKREKPDYVDYDDSNDADNDLEPNSAGLENVSNPDIDMNHYLSVEHIKKEREDNPTSSTVANASSTQSEEKNDPNLRKSTASPNRSPENLDFNLTVTRTTRGHDQLVYDNYTYLKTTHQPQGDIARWKCTSYYATKTGCRAKLHTTMNGMCVLLDSITEHNHPPPDEKQLKIILFREQVKQIANNHPEMKPTEILTNARMLLDTPTSLGLKDESIMRYIQRVRSKNKMEKLQKEQQVESERLKSEIAQQGLNQQQQNTHQNQAELLKDAYKTV